MANYLVTGGLGFIGQFIVQALHDHDPAGSIRVLARTRRKTHLGVEHLDRVDVVYGDLTGMQDLEAALRGVDTVVHNAALVSFRRSEAPAVFRANVIGSRNLAQAALRAGCRDFIFISSISAVGHQPGRESDEESIPEPGALRRSNMYGFTKLTTESELREIAGKMRVIMLNPSVVLGPGSDRIGLILKAARLLPVLPLPSYINSFVDVRDVARAVVLALTKGRSGERYIVTAHHEDMLEFTRLTLAAMGKRLWLLPVADRGLIALDAVLALLDLAKLNPGIRRFSEMNVDHRYSTEKIKRELDWEPEYSLEQSIRATVGAYRRQGGT